MELEASHRDIAATDQYGTSAIRQLPQRNTVRDTWRWLWKDTLGRVVPLAACAFVYARVSGQGRAAIGLTLGHWQREVALGLGLGVPLAGLAAAYRRWVAPGYRLPTRADQIVQSIFYLLINAPAEELFWRATVQTLLVSGARKVRGIEGASVPLGWLFTTSIFGAYHRLGGWSWAAIAGVTFAGGVFGLVYRPWDQERSILSATIVHGLATAGFLSWGDVALHWMDNRRG